MLDRRMRLWLVHMSGTLAIIGAGAKAVAVAAKAAVLREMGIEVADVVAVERSGVAANWRAGGGWTDGRQRLGTSPEKDVGFPYRSTSGAGPQHRTRRADDAVQLAVLSGCHRPIRGLDRPGQAGADARHLGRGTCAGSPTWWI